MFREVLRTQWKWSTTGVVVGTVVAFALPLMTVQGAGPADATWIEAQNLLEAQRGWARWYPLLALAVGLLVGTGAWANDHRVHHVYALTLPVARWHFVLLRYAAGLVLLIAPMVALTVGASVAGAAATVPSGLNAYPVAVAIRFALAVVVAYSIFFAISSGTTRTAGYVLSVVGGIVVVQVLFQLSGNSTNLLTAIFDRIVTWPGPFEIFSGRWMLIDV